MVLPPQPCDHPHVTWPHLHVIPVSRDPTSPSTGSPWHHTAPPHLVSCDPPLSCGLVPPATWPCPPDFLMSAWRRHLALQWPLGFQVMADFIWEKSCAIRNFSRQNPTPGYRALDMTGIPFPWETKSSPSFLMSFWRK